MIYRYKQLIFKENGVKVGHLGNVVGGAEYYDVFRETGRSAIPASSPSSFQQAGSIPEGQAS